MTHIKLKWVIKMNSVESKQCRVTKKLKSSPLKRMLHGILITSKVALASNSALAYAETDTENLIQLKALKISAPAIHNDNLAKTYNTKRSNTATKTESELRDIPQAVSVVSQEQIKDQAIQSIAEAIRYTPGVTAIQGEGNRDAIVFRGNATTGDFFIDGTRDDVQTYRDLYNTDRIEVLKGPSGMIFGRGGAGGVINRVSKEANWSKASQITAQYGADQQKRISADFNQVMRDEIAFRINTVYEHSDSYRNGVNLERYGVTPTVTIKPNDQTKITLGIEHFQDKRTNDRGVPSANGAGDNINNRKPYQIDQSSAFYGSANVSPTETETMAFNATLEHALDNGIEIKNRTRYAHYNKYYQNVFADSAVKNNGEFTVRGYRDTTERKT